MKKYLIFAGSDGKQEPAATEPATQQPQAIQEPVTQQEPQQKAQEPTKTAEPQKSTISDEEAKLLKEIMKKKEELKAAQAKIDDLENLKKSIDALGGIDKLSKMIQDDNDRQTKALEAKGEWEKLKQQMNEAHQKAMKEVNDKLATLTKENEESKQKIVELTIGAAFNNSQFIANQMTLTPAKARVIYSGFFDLVDGAVIGYDKPRGKEGRVQLVDQYGNALPFDQALEKIVNTDPDVDMLLRSKVKSGAGSASKSGGVAVTPVAVHGRDKILQGLAALK